MVAEASFDSDNRRKAPPPEMQLSVLAGVIERVTYQNEETGYVVAKLQPDNGRADDLIAVVGTLPSVSAGEKLELQGWWKNHASYGRQFEVVNYKVLLPATIMGMKKYIGSGLIKGIGPATSAKIVDYFGLNTIDILEKSPNRLVEVPGLGMKRANLIKKAWSDQRAIKEVMIFLQGIGISTSLAVRIYKKYEDGSISVVKNTPYRLADEVFGIGFKTADKIAVSLGIAKDSPERIKSGIKFTLGEASGDGHVFLPRQKLIEASVTLLEVEAEQIENALDELKDEPGDLGVVTQSLHRLENVATPNKPQHERKATAAEEAELERQLREEGASYDFEETVDPWNGPASDDERIEAIYLTPFLNAERGISSNILRLKNASSNKDRLASFKSVSFEVVFEYLANKEGLKLEERQKEAVRMALTEKVGVLTGGPGTGKTTSMRALLRVLAIKNKKVILAAPTGRAAKRLSEATGAPATTIHRLLELRPGGKAAFDRDTPLDTDILIVDEASMLDVLLMNNLVKSVPNGAHLLLVGDTDQLPSVGAGNVLSDIVASEVVPVIRLNHIFRQGADSAIVTNAHRINQGQMPITGKGIADFFFLEEKDTLECAKLVVQLVSERLPRKYGYDPIKDIQVLAPMHRTAAGVAELNTRLQEVLNPAGIGKVERRLAGKLFRVGDKVMQLKNNYDKLVFNGDGGIILSIDTEEQTLSVRLEDNREVDYDFAELDELTLAYAVSVHKSQGSEYPVVVIPLVSAHYMMLQRNLVYTGVTRARKLVVLVGSKQALATAVRNNKTSNRFSGLAVRLREFANFAPPDKNYRADEF